MFRQPNKRRQGRPAVEFQVAEAGGLEERLVGMAQPPPVAAQPREVPVVEGGREVPQKAAVPGEEVAPRAARLDAVEAPARAAVAHAAAEAGSRTCH